MELIGEGWGPLKSLGLRSKQDTFYDSAAGRRRASERKTVKQKKKKERKAGALPVSGILQYTSRECVPCWRLAKDSWRTSKIKGDHYFFTTKCEIFGRYAFRSKSRTAEFEKGWDPNYSAIVQKSLLFSRSRIRCGKVERGCTAQREKMGRLININILSCIMNAKVFPSTVLLFHLLRISRNIYTAHHRKLKSDLAALYQTPSFMQVSVTDAAIWNDLSRRVTSHYGSLNADRLNNTQKRGLYRVNLAEGGS